MERHGPVKNTEVELSKVSIITPLFNEELIIPELAQRLSSALHGHCTDWEWVAVDDGSTDQTFQAIQHAIQIAPHWQVLRLSRNFGQQAAYRAGLEAAQGDAVVFLDADLQDPPEEIPPMISLWKQGYQLVVGVRSDRPERGFRGFLIWVFHEMFFRLAQGVMPKNSGTFSLMDRRLVDELIKMRERGIFLPAQRSWLGFKSTKFIYKRAARKGQPKQSYAKLFAYAWEGITSFSIFPLQLISLVGFIISILGFGYAAGLIGVRFLQAFGLFSNYQVLGFTTLSVAILCLGGIQLLSLGLLGAYLGKVFQEVKQRPFFIATQHLKSVAGK